MRGWDDYAETKLEQLAQPSSMGKKMLRITGARLNQYIKDKPEIYSRVVSIGSLISLYLETLVSNTSINRSVIVCECAHFFQNFHL